MDDEELLARLCHDVVGRCDGAWRSIVYRAEFGAGWFACDEDVDGEGRVRGWPANDLVQQLSTHFGRTDLELRVDADRTFEAVLTSGELGYRSPYERVIDPDGRPVPPPLPPSTLPPTGDPARVPALVAEYAALFESITGRPPRRNPPATPEAIAALEEQLGVEFPADLRALYLLADGDAEDPGPVGLRLLPLDQVPDARQGVEGNAEHFARHPHEWAEEVRYRGPGGAVRPVW